MFRGGRRAAIGNTSSVELVQRSMFGCAKRAVAYTCLSFAFFLGCAGHPVKPPNGAATPPASISRALVGHHDLLNLPGWESRLGDDEMNLNCNLFDHSGGAENNVVFRATTNLHEAWHAWEHANVHFGAISHLPGPQGNCSIKGDEACDPFYAHDLDTFHPFGRLIETGVSVAGLRTDTVMRNRDQPEEVSQSDPDRVGVHVRSARGARRLGDERHPLRGVGFSVYRRGLFRSDAAVRLRSDEPDLIIPV